MKIMCLVDYSFEGGVEPCKARVDLLLPMVRWKLHPRLLQEEKELLGETLHEDWGHYILLKEESTKYSYRSEHISGSSWEEVDEKVRELLKELAVTLADILERSSRLLKEKPENKFFILQPEQRDWTPVPPFCYDI